MLLGYVFIYVCALFAGNGSALPLPAVPMEKFGTVKSVFLDIRKSYFCLCLLGALAGEKV